MTSRTRLLALPALSALLALPLVACSGGDDDLPPPGSRGIDARAYYDDYETEAQDMAMSAVPEAMAGSATDRSDDVGPVDVPSPGEDNTFVDHGVQGFTPTTEDAESTFALDVDDGSFGVARQFLTSGLRIPPASIRTEEWVNALPYSDAAPTDADLGLTAETGPVPTLAASGDGTALVRVGVSAREVDPADRPRANVTLVVDTSGSMDIRERLGLVQSSLALLADRLDEDDTVSVVTFEERAVLLLPPTPVSDTDAILETVEDLTPGGGTNLEAGIRLGYEQARKAFDEDALNLVVLCSDGVANIGATGPGSITDTIAEEGADGISLVTVGYGLGNYNDHLMEQLANLGDGFYSYVDTFDEAEQLFGSELTTTLVPVAREARAQVRFDPEVVTSYRLIGYENRELADEDFEDLAVDAGELGSGHHATALYEVELADGVEPGATLGTATVLWEDLASGDAEQADVELTLGDTGDGAASPDLELAATAADLAQFLKGKGPIEDRGVTLDDLAARVDALVADDVPGADELAEIVAGVREAR